MELTDTNTEIEIFDNFLEEEYFNQLKSLFLNPYFPWYIQPHVVDNDSVDGFMGNDSQFTHIFSEENQINSDYYQYLSPLLEKLNVNYIRRIKANLTTKTPETHWYEYHTDYSYDLDDSKTGILYINTNDGKTSFDNGIIVSSKENRFLKFPTKILHTGSTHTDIPYCRIVLNINWY